MLKSIAQLIERIQNIATEVKQRQEASHNTDSSQRLATASPPTGRAISGTVQMIDNLLFLGDATGSM